MPAPLRIAAYVDLRYTARKPTGVDKHIARMVYGLASTPGFAVSVLAPRSQLAAPARDASPSAAAGGGCWDCGEWRR